MIKYTLTSEERYIIDFIRDQSYSTITVRVENGKPIGKIRREDTHIIK